MLVAMPGQADSLLKSIAPGSWGGKHIRMNVTEVGATLEFDCAKGIIDEPLLADEGGNFEAFGKLVVERGGSVRLGEPPPAQQSARFHGWTDGSQMHLTVTLLKSGEVFGSFLLGLGWMPQIDKCL